MKYGIAFLILIFSLNSVADRPGCKIYLGSRELQNLQFANSAFSSFVEENREKKLSQADLQPWVERLETTTAAYFTAIGIEFEKVSFKHRSFPKINYYQFKLVASSQASDLGRLLQGVFYQKKLRDTVLFYDPLWFLVNPRSHGFYEPDLRKVTFGFDALSARHFGLADLIRHEIHHALEDAKLFAERPTLASFEFTSEKTTGPYSAYLALDELESYLRDLRFYKHISLRHEVYITTERLRKEMPKFRKDRIAHAITVIKEIIIKGRAVLNEMKSARYTVIIEGSKPAELVFENLKNPYYPTATVRLVLKKSETPDQGLRRLISWAENRIAQIEAEIEKFE